MERMGWPWRALQNYCCCCQVTSVVSNSVRPHRRQPTRLPRPWDSSGKNTGVGCHFLLQCMKVKSESKVAQLYLTLSDPMDCSPPGTSVHGSFQARVLEWGAIAFSLQNYQCFINNYVFVLSHIQLCSWTFPGKNTGVGCHFLLQGIFLTQGWNLCLLCLLHWQADSLSTASPPKTQKQLYSKRYLVRY